MRALDLAWRAFGDCLIHSRSRAMERSRARFFRAFLVQALFLHGEKRRIIAFVRNALAAIEFQNPARHIVEEVAIVGDEDDAAFIFAQRVLQPLHRLRVEMVGRLVEQENVGRVEQELAQRHAAALAARER